MKDEWDKFNAADWVIQNCWEQITGPKPQTHAWLLASDIGADDPPWKTVLEAVELILLYEWIDFKNYGYSLSDPGASSVNRISLTEKALADIKQQLEDHPESAIKFGA